MEELTTFFSTLMDSEKLIVYGGLTLFLIIIFAETGLMVGFFLPGDYLLFTAGLLCGTQYLDVSIFTLTVSATIAAIVGDYTGYFTGKFLGPKIFKRNDSWLFKKKHLEKTDLIFKKYGASTLIIGRFLPIVRTFAPILAGATSQPVSKFSLLNISGAILWCGSLILVGYFFGRQIPNAADYIGHIVFISILVTSLVLIWGMIKAKIEMKKVNKINNQYL